MTEAVPTGAGTAEYRSCLRNLTAHRDKQRRQTPPQWVRIRDAAARARKVYPGAVGELVARELSSYAELGWLLRPESLPERVIGEVLGHPAPSNSIDTSRR